jgi:uncharacterized protein
MRLDDIAESGNVDDRRSQGGGMGLPMGGGGGLGIGTMIVLGILGYALGIDPRLLIGGAELVGGLTNRSAPQVQRQGPPANDAEIQFLRRVVGLNEQIWTQILPQQAGKRFNPPQLVVFRGYTQSGCGAAQSAMGPFYCPLDRKVYLDTAFFEEMRRKLGGGGDFAYAYVIGHEVGHHIQNELGLLPKVQQAQRAMEQTQANRLQVSVELQADCYAGVWAHHADARFRVIEQGDVDEALRTASAIGDDNSSAARAASWCRRASPMVRPSNV